jgi:DNA ligase-1
MTDLQDGESIEIQGSAKKPYVIKNVGGVYSCTCPAWRNQSLAIEQRTCKHIRKLRGDDAEQERVGNALPAKRESKSETDGPPLLLAHAWQNDVDLTDWWMSEKLDGVRAWWDGRRFLSRQGNEFHAPDWFAAGLPETPLDGELWLDRKAFQRTVSIVRRQDKSDHWKQIRYVVFDAPALDAPFEERLKFVADRVRGIGSQFVDALPHERCQGLEHLGRELQRIESLGGEGLMLRQPGSRYEAGRSTSLLKVKTFHDADAVVVEHIAGKGRHKGRMGAVLARLAGGVEFSVGTGFSDKQRENPPPPGSTITFRYQELTDAGVPRFPSFVRVRTDAAPSATPTETKASRKTKTPKSQPATTIAAQQGVAGASHRRYFELVDGKSAKFWEITIDGNDVTVRYGRIGAGGQTNSKTFPDAEAAQTHADRLIEQKTGKGYTEGNAGD